MATKTIRLNDGNDTLLPEAATAGQGYQKCADGTLILWGGTSFSDIEIGGNANKVINFVVPFATDDGYVVSFFSQYNYPSLVDAVATRIDKTSCRLYVVNKGNGTLRSILMGWIAIGRWK